LGCYSIGKKYYYVRFINKFKRYNFLFQLLMSLCFYTHTLAFLEDLKLNHTYESVELFYEHVDLRYKEVSLFFLYLKKLCCQLFFLFIVRIQLLRCCFALRIFIGCGLSTTLFTKPFNCYWLKKKWTSECIMFKNLNLLRNLWFQSFFVEWSKLLIKKEDNKNYLSRIHFSGWLYKFLECQ
jgi:hypothetical protein